MNEQDDMDLKRAMDALPRSIEPPADLWPGVRAGLARRSGQAVKRPSVIRIAALLSLLAVSAGALMVTRRQAATWRVAATLGAARVLHAGDTLASAMPTRIAVGRIGLVDVESGSLVRVLRASATEQRMALTRGTIHAQISAPPRLFVVETPSGTAVDLGCAYTLGVDPEGNSLLQVSLGWVSFEDQQGRSLIPAGMHALGRRQHGIGTPVMDDAAQQFQLAVAAFDVAPSDSGLGVILSGARTRDAVTLWHLVGRTGGARRTRVIDRLTGLVALPVGVPREAIEHNDYGAMSLYWTALPGTLPIIPSWQQALWRLWIKITG